MASTNGRQEDNYLACSEYAGHAGVGEKHEGLVAFRHKNGEYYFAWYDAKGNVLMRSEGYPTAAARDNGMASVAKNRNTEARFSIVEKSGSWFVVLQAGNYQEIARSCSYKSRSDAEMLLPSKREVAAKQAKAHPVAAATTAAVVVTQQPIVEERMPTATEAEALRLKKQAEELLGSSEGMPAQKLY
jgi:uncharacterized protein YegP (UPF0339 family)